MYMFGKLRDLLFWKRPSTREVGCDRAGRYCACATILRLRPVKPQPAARRAPAGLRTRHRRLQ